MLRSSFRQPLPDGLATMMAKGYRRSDLPPLGFFETIGLSPAGALSATGTDMGRFMRALMNGRELDGVRILSKTRLDEMMAGRRRSRPRVHRSERGGPRRDRARRRNDDLFSTLTMFPGQGVGVFELRSGIGAITELSDIPDPATAIAQRFLPEVPQHPPEAAAAPAAGAAGIAGIYHSSRCAESSLARMNDLMTQIVVRIDSAGDARVSAAIWPFAAGQLFKRVDGNVYQGRGGFDRVTVIDDAGSESRVATAVSLMQRVPWSLDVRWIAPALIMSTAVALLTLVAWPFAALWRWRHRSDGGSAPATGACFCPRGLSCSSMWPSSSRPRSFSGRVLRIGPFSMRS
jgi:CubicO group peptidase (beta-lactamase class C family)